MTKKQPYQVLLYYNYVTIDDPNEFAEEHLDFCKQLAIKGRILVANEGINGTVSGTSEQMQQYMDKLHADPRFADTIFKIDESETHAFNKMHVRARPELVTLRLEDDINPKQLTGNYLEPKDFYEAMQDEDTVILDARNDYEFDVGHFEGAIRPDIRTFRELPAWIRDNKELIEGKQILTYCTGGIRCEKFSGWLLKEGFENVSQLHGGIAAYGKDPEVQGKLWNGRCYVFDSRLSVPINQHEHVIVGRDHFDGEPCERYVNCAEPTCNEQILCSEENEHKFLRGCTHECRISPRNRYVEEHNLTDEEIQARLEVIENENDIKLMA